MRRALLVMPLLAACATARVKGTLVEYPEAVVAETSRPRKLALVVGVDAFLDPSWRPLRFAGIDAEAMGAALEGFDEVVVLRGAEATTRAKVLEALHRLLGMAQAKGDVVVVYFSTHGTLARPPGGALERYLVMADSRGAELPATALPVKAVLAAVQNARAARTLVVLDACYSGEGKSQLDASLTSELQRLKAPFWAEPLESVSEATVVLSASAWGEPALEDDALGHGVFTHFLLEGLAKGDANRDGAVTATEAHDWARARTYYFTGGRQRPSASVQMTGVDPLVLKGRRAQPGLPLLHGSDARLTGLELWLDGRSKGALPLTVAVEPGAHAVELRLPGTPAPLVQADVSLAADEALPLERLLPEPRRWWVSAAGGGRGFLGAGALLPEVAPSVGVSVEVDHVFGRRGWLGLELSGGEGPRRVGDAFRAAAGFGELGLTGGARWRSGVLEFGLGARAAGTVLWRRFEAAGLENDLALVPSASLLGTLGARFGRWQPRLQLASGLAPLRLDGRVVVLGHVEARLALAFALDD